MNASESGKLNREMKRAFIVLTRLRRDIRAYCLVLDTEYTLQLKSRIYLVAISANGDTPICLLQIEIIGGPLISLARKWSKAFRAGSVTRAPRNFCHKSFERGDTEEERKKLQVIVTARRVSFLFHHLRGWTYVSLYDSIDREDDPIPSACERFTEAMPTALESSHAEGGACLIHR